MATARSLYYKSSANAEIARVVLVTYHFVAKGEQTDREATVASNSVKSLWATFLSQTIWV